MDLAKYQNELRKFADERDWHEFHTPENLVKSVAIEAGELLECYQWQDAPYIKDVIEEVGDIFIYLLMFADKLGIELEGIVAWKIEQNAKKYPIDKSRGNAIKYNKR
jgi:NTP pyrophosphatase (non-canonical NTP hydrolase)